MSYIPKRHTVLTVVFILTTGAISVSAQTPAAVDSSSVKPPADAAATAESTNEPNSESKKPSFAFAEKTFSSRLAADNISAVNRDTVNEEPFAMAAAPTAALKTARLAETPTRGFAFPRSPQAAGADKWHFQVSPYFWLASLHGTAGIGNRSVQVDESFGDIWHSLDFALMGVFEAQKGKLVILADTEYVAISDDQATPGPLFSNVNAKFKTFIFDPEVGYRVFENPAKGQSIDVLGGIRVWHVSTDFAFGAGFLPAIEVQSSRNWVDAIVGLRGKTALSEKVFLSGKFDLGGGGSKFTWQVFGGLGYNIKPNIALIGGYRVLDVDYDKNNFLYDMNQRGPIMGLGFRF